jgi:hypothetical protein
MHEARVRSRYIFCSEVAREETAAPFINNPRTENNFPTVATSARVLVSRLLSLDKCFDQRVGTTSEPKGWYKESIQLGLFSF